MNKKKFETLYIIIQSSVLGLFVLYMVLVAVFK